MDEIMKLRDLLLGAKQTVFFGGAGVSTESGIPDFRSTDGLYHQKWKYPPETIISHSFFQQRTEEFFRFYREKMLFPDVKPNAAHKALAKLDSCRKNREIPTVITAALGGAFCELLFAKTAADAGKTQVDALLSDFGIRPSKRYFIRQYLRDAPRIPRGYPEMAVKVLSEVDLLQKSSAADPWLLLEQGIERIRRWRG